MITQINSTDKNCACATFPLPVSRNVRTRAVLSVDTQTLEVLSGLSCVEWVVIVQTLLPTLRNTTWTRPILLYELLKVADMDRPSFHRTKLNVILHLTNLLGREWYSFPGIEELQEKCLQDTYMYINWNINIEVRDPVTFHPRTHPDLYAIRWGPDLVLLDELFEGASLTAEPQAISIPT